VIGSGRLRRGRRSCSGGLDQPSHPARTVSGKDTSLKTRCKRRPREPAACGLPTTSTIRNSLERTMNLIIWLIVGGLVGWAASLLMRTDAQQGIVLNVVVGIVGAALAGFFVSPLLGLPTINEGVFSLGALLVSLVGAVILLAIVNLVRRGTPR
jgi:uncharacterized membrane protein YeaQ/YmgE (transglycosylase-associated protein family)